MLHLKRVWLVLPALWAGILELGAAHGGAGSDESLGKQTVGELSKRQDSGNNSICFFPDGTLAKDFNYGPCGDPKTGFQSCCDFSEKDICVPGTNLCYFPAGPAGNKSWFDKSCSTICTTNNPNRYEHVSYCVKTDDWCCVKSVKGGDCCNDASKRFPLNIPRDIYISITTSKPTVDDGANPPSVAPVPGPQPKPGLDTGAMIGIAVGVGVLVVVLFMACFCGVKRDWCGSRTALTKCLIGFSNVSMPEIKLDEDVESGSAPSINGKQVSGAGTFLPRSMPAIRNGSESTATKTVKMTSLHAVDTNADENDEPSLVVDAIQRAVSAPKQEGEGRDDDANLGIQRSDTFELGTDSPMIEMSAARNCGTTSNRGSRRG